MSGAAPMIPQGGMTTDWSDYAKLARRPAPGRVQGNLLYAWFSKVTKNWRALRAIHA
jgi:hypothetical protein